MAILYEDDMKIQFTVMSPEVGATYKRGTILINTAINHRERRRYMISSLVHELTHWAMDCIWGLPENPYDSYRQEIWCYRTQWLAQLVMMMRHRVNREEGALLSTILVISQMKANRYAHIV